jgi:purine-binding chemotaxis protein CheW
LNGSPSIQLVVEFHHDMANSLNEIQFACFSLDNILFCVDLMRIKEIIPAQVIITLPTPTRYLDGVINLRGSVIPVMNLKKRFGIPGVDNAAIGNLIVVKLANQLLALSVDEVHEVITVPIDKIKAVPDIEEGLGAECILGVCLHADNVYIVLGIDMLISSAESDVIFDV